MNIEDYESLPTTSVGVNMTAGAFAGIMEHCIMYPIDSVKTRMQALVPGPGGGGGIGTVLVRMIQQEGLLRPIRGMGAMVVGAGPAHALYFSCYEFLKDKFMSSKPHSQFNHLVYGAAGCVSTILHDGVMNPAEVVKQRLQMYNSPYRNVINCIKHVYKREGVYAFYRSYTTQLAMNVPFQSIHFIAYEFAQSITNPDHVYSPRAHMISGAMAGAVAAAVTTPLDVCKTLLNTQQDGVKARGMVDAFKKIYRLGGLQGYFRGINARVLYQMPATAICWTTYVKAYGILTDETLTYVKVVKSYKKCTVYIGGYEFFKYILHNKQEEGLSIDMDECPPSGVNQNQPLTSRSSSFQGTGLYFQNNAHTTVLLKVRS